MRARHRHFNPRDAGANLVYDSRRVYGLSDNDPVSTWPDISRNAYDATGSSTARPLYKTAVQGGNPTLRFDGSNDRMELAIGPSISTGAGNEIQVVIKQISFTAGGSAFPVIMDLKTNLTNNWVFIYSSNASYNWPAFGSGASWSNLRWNATANTNFNIINVGYNGSGATTNGNFSLHFNGDSKSLTASGGFGGTTVNPSIGGRSGANLFNNADYYQVTLINSAASNSLRKRLNHAAAFSFKIACN